MGIQPDKFARCCQMKLRRYFTSLKEMEDDEVLKQIEKPFHWVYGQMNVLGAR